MTTELTFIGVFEMLKHPEQRLRALSILKTYEGNDPAILGLKLYLEKHNFSFNSIEFFVESSEQQFNSKQSIKSNHSKKSFWKIAATFALLIGLGTTLYYYQNQTPAYYAKYANPEPGLPVFMDESVNPYANWMNEFKSEAYPEALETGLILFKNNPKNDTVNYYLAVIYSELGEEKEVLNHLNLMSNSTNVINEKANYLKAITLLYSDRKQAEKLLLEISKQANHFANQAAIKTLKSEF